MSGRLDSAPLAIARWATETPDNVFVEEADGDRGTMTYGESLAAAHLWAGAFRRLGVRSGDVVATILPSSIDAVSCWFGLAWLRALDTGIHADYRGTALSSLLQTVRPKVVVAAAENCAVLAEVIADTSTITTVVVRGSTDVVWPSHITVLSVEELLHDAPIASDLTPPERHDIACVVFTSGTTGPSKGVLVPWGNYFSGLAVFSDVTADDCFYSPFPLCHAAGRSPCTWIGVPGGRWVIRRSFRTSDFWPDLVRHGCTTTQMIPVMVNWLLKSATEADVASSPLRKIVTAPLSQDLLDLQKRFDLRVRTVYGMTEIGMAIYRFVDDDDIESAGRVGPGYEVRIVDELDYDVPTGTVGEMIVRTKEPWSLNVGYVNMPAESAEAWRNGWFHTGDGLLQRADGDYVFVDRLKDSLRRRGENISSFELEAVLLTHPAVAECAAIGVAAESDEQEIKFCVVLTEPGAATEAELVAFMEPQVPAFMVPRFVELCDSLPRTDVTNRVKKKLLRQVGVNAATWDRLKR